MMETFVIFRCLNLVNTSKSYIILESLLFQRFVNSINDFQKLVQNLNFRNASKSCLLLNFVRCSENSNGIKVAI